jgi:hypothetical protein
MSMPTSAAASRCWKVARMALPVCVWRSPKCSRITIRTVANSINSRSGVVKMPRNSMLPVSNGLRIFWGRGPQTLRARFSRKIESAMVASTLLESEAPRSRRNKVRSRMTPSSITPMTLATRPVQKFSPAILVSQ